MFKQSTALDLSVSIELNSPYVLLDSTTAHSTGGNTPAPLAPVYSNPYEKLNGSVHLSFLNPLNNIKKIVVRFVGATVARYDEPTLPSALRGTHCHFDKEIILYNDDESEFSLISFSSSSTSSFEPPSKSFPFGLKIPSYCPPSLDSTCHAKIQYYVIATVFFHETWCGIPFLTKGPHTVTREVFVYKEILPPLPLVEEEWRVIKKT